jgi:hypothetical protein
MRARHERGNLPVGKRKPETDCHVLRPRNDEHMGLFKLKLMFKNVIFDTS